MKMKLSLALVILLTCLKNFDSASLEAVTTREKRDLSMEGYGYNNMPYGEKQEMGYGKRYENEDDEYKVRPYGEKQEMGYGKRYENENDEYKVRPYGEKQEMGYGKKYEDSYDEYKMRPYGEKKEMGYGKKYEDSYDEYKMRPYGEKQEMGYGKRYENENDEYKVRPYGYGKYNDDDEMKYHGERNYDEDEKEYKKPNESNGSKANYVNGRGGERLIEKIKIKETIILKEKPHKYGILNGKNDEGYLMYKNYEGDDYMRRGEKIYGNEKKYESEYGNGLNGHRREAYGVGYLGNGKYGLNNKAY